MDCCAVRRGASIAKILFCVGGVQWDAKAVGMSRGCEDVP